MNRALSTNRDSSAYTQIRKNNAIGKTSTSIKNPVKFNSYSPSYVKSKLKQCFTPVVVLTGNPPSATGL